MNTQAVAETSLRLERLIPVSPEELFALWIQPAQLIKWWGPEQCETTIHTLDTVPGGHWRISMRRPDGITMGMGGSYRIVEPPRLLAFSWAWENEHGEAGQLTEVIVSFDRAPGGTRLTVVQTHFENRPTRERHDAGWSTAIDRLTRLASPG